VEDPAFFSDGKRLVFHRKPDKQTAAALAIIGADGQGYQEITPAIGAGHAAVSPAEAAVVFTTSGRGLLLITREADHWASTQKIELPEKEELSKGDRRFAEVAMARSSYVEWIAPDLLLVTVHGSDLNGHFSFARLFLLKLTGQSSSVFYDLSAAIEAATGTTGGDFCTADGMVMGQ
jgi:hypothetical protein